MVASSVTGTGLGAVPNLIDRNIAPKIVASGILSGDGSSFLVLLPYPLKRGINNYIVNGIIENPIPSNGGTDSVSIAKGISITKLDDRWSFLDGNWVYNDDIDPGNMKGFIIHTDEFIGGGEGSRDTQIMWSVCTTGYDPSEFA
jgi:hypothetical protein